MFSAGLSRIPSCREREQREVVIVCDENTSCKFHRFLSDEKKDEVRRSRTLFIEEFSYSTRACNHVSGTSGFVALTKCI